MTNNASTSAENHSKAFKDVFIAELKAVYERRMRVREAGDMLPPSGEEERNLQTAISGSAGNLVDLQKQVLKANLCGLAISGGGIRSATFAFGVIQGLAVAGLVPRFDYLSTVSGGGYIGSWLSVWINRLGLRDVEQQLKPPGLRDDTVSVSSDAEQPSGEGRAIRHLRLYSNYLAPLPGVFSFDGWVLIAIYLRNLILNQSVLLFGTLSLLVVLRLLIELFSVMRSTPSGSWFSLAIASACVVSLGTATIGTGAIAPSHIKQETGRWNWSDWTLAVSSWLVAAVSTALLFSSIDAPNWFLSDDAWGWTLLTTCLSLAAIFAVMGALGMSRRLAASVAGLFGGAIAGAILFSGWMLLFAVFDSRCMVVAGAVAIGVPLTLITFVFAQFVQVGLVGPRLPDLEREWWSGHNSRLLMLASAWLGLLSIVIFAPWAIGQLLQIHWGGTLSSLLGAGWLGTVIAGLRAAYGANTGSRRGSTSLSGWLAQLTPGIFLVGVLVIVALLAEAIASNVWAAVAGNPALRFENRLNTLLTDLDHFTTPIKLANGIEFPAWAGLITGAVAFILMSWLLGWRIGVNAFSLHALYANRLVRCYLGASNEERQPHPLTNFDDQDDVALAELSPGEKSAAGECNGVISNGVNVESDNEFSRRLQKSLGPFMIVNGALNRKAGAANGGPDSAHRRTSPERQAESLAFIERKAESWVFTPQYCGSETTGYCSTSEFAGNIDPRRPNLGIRLGTAMAVSGAAVSPNMGFHSSPAVTALLTVFNVRLGAWFGNPRLKDARTSANPPASWRLLLNELTGDTGADSQYVYVSDGGHFENLGVYELIRRRCRFIVVIDAGADPQIHENVGHLVRKVRVDFGVRIDVNMTPVTPDSNGKAAAHLVIGRIHYGDVHRPDVEQEPADPDYLYENNQGIIIWLKNSLVGDEPGDLLNFNAMHPEFPFDTTLDQFFSESQFESYRVLGLVTARKMLENVYFPAAGKDQQIQKERLEQRPAQIQAAVQLTLDNAKKMLGGADGGYDFKEVQCQFIAPNQRRVSSALYQYPTEPLFRTLFNYWLAKPPQFVTDYAEQNQSYIAVLNKLRTDPKLRYLAQELYGSNAEKSAAKEHNSTGESDIALAERLMAAEMLTLLENVWFALDLERHYLHPVHAGWLGVFKNWLLASHVRCYWDDQPESPYKGLKQEFSPVFQRFVERVQSGKC